MAKDNSFDIVSETDMQEVENAFNNTEKGLKQRYDLKGFRIEGRFRQGRQDHHRARPERLREQPGHRRAQHEPHQA